MAAAGWGGNDQSVSDKYRKSNDFHPATHNNPRRTIVAHLAYLAQSLWNASGLFGKKAFRDDKETITSFMRSMKRSNKKEMV